MLHLLLSTFCSLFQQGSCYIKNVINSRHASAPTHIILLMAKPGQITDAQKRSNEIDAILNRHRVNLAQHQKIVEGWFPLSKQEREHDVQKGEAEVTPVESLLRPEL